MEKTILNFHFDYLNPSLTTTPKSDYVIYVLPLNCWPQEMMISFRKPLCWVFHPHQSQHHQSVPSLLGEWASSSAIFITCNPLYHLSIFTFYFTDILYPEIWLTDPTFFSRLPFTICTTRSRICNSYDAYANYESCDKSPLWYLYSCTMIIHFPFSHSLTTIFPVSIQSGMLCQLLHLLLLLHLLGYILLFNQQR